MRKALTGKGINRIITPFMRIFTWQQRVIVFGSTLLTVGLFVLAGYLIGRLVNDVPLLIALSVLVSYPFSQFAIIKTLKKTNYGGALDKTK